MVLRGRLVLRGLRCDRRTAVGPHAVAPVREEGELVIAAAGGQGL